MIFLVFSRFSTFFTSHPSIFYYFLHTPIFLTIHVVFTKIFFFAPGKIPSYTKFIIMPCLFLILAKKEGLNIQIYLILIFILQPLLFPLFSVHSDTSHIDLYLFRSAYPIRTKLFKYISY